MMRKILVAGLLCLALPAAAETLKPETTGKDNRRPQSALGPANYSENFRALRLVPVRPSSGGGTAVAPPSSPRMITTPIAPLASERHAAQIPLRPPGQSRGMLEAPPVRRATPGSTAVIPQSTQSPQTKPPGDSAEPRNRVIPRPSGWGGQAGAGSGGTPPASGWGGTAGTGANSATDPKQMATQMLLNSMMGGMGAMAGPRLGGMMPGQ